jgi:hypothetical protein
VHEARAVHRLDHGDDIRIAESMHEPRKTVGIGRHSARVDERSVDAAGVPVEAFAAEIEPGVDTHLRDLLGSRLRDVRGLGEALPHHIQILDPTKACAVIH